MWSAKAIEASEIVMSAHDHIRTVSGLTSPNHNTKPASDAGLPRNVRLPRFAASHPSNPAPARNSCRKTICVHLELSPLIISRRLTERFEGPVITQHRQANIGDCLPLADSAHHEPPTHFVTAARGTESRFPRDVLEGALHPETTFLGATAGARKTLPHTTGGGAAQICQLDLESEACRGAGRAGRRAEVAGRRAGVVPAGSQPLCPRRRGRPDIERMLEQPGVTAAGRPDQFANPN